MDRFKKPSIDSQLSRAGSSKTSEQKREDREAQIGQAQERWWLANSPETSLSGNTRKTKRPRSPEPQDTNASNTPFENTRSESARSVRSKLEQTYLENNPLTKQEKRQNIKTEMERLAPEIEKDLKNFSSLSDTDKHKSIKELKDRQERFEKLKSKIQPDNQKLDSALRESISQLESACNDSNSLQEQLEKQKEQLISEGNFMSKETSEYYEGLLVTYNARKQSAIKSLQEVTNTLGAKVDVNASDCLPKLRSLANDHRKYMSELDAASLIRNRRIHDLSQAIKASSTSENEYNRWLAMREYAAQLTKPGFPVSYVRTNIEQTPSHGVHESPSIEEQLPFDNRDKGKSKGLATTEELTKELKPNISDSNEYLVNEYKRLLRSAYFQTLARKVNAYQPITLEASDKGNPEYSTETHKIVIPSKTPEGHTRSPEETRYAILFEMHNASTRDSTQHIQKHFREKVNDPNLKELSFYHRAAYALAIEWIEWTHHFSIDQCIKHINADPNMKREELRITEYSSEFFVPVGEDRYLSTWYHFMNYLERQIEVGHTKGYDPRANDMTNWVGINILQAAHKLYPASFKITEKQVQDWQNGEITRIKSLDENPFLSDTLIDLSREMASEEQRNRKQR